MGISMNHLVFYKILLPNCLFVLCQVFNICLTCFLSGLYIGPLKESNSTLIAVCAVCIIMVVLAILVSVYCCRKYGNCTPDKSSQFFVEDANENQFAYTLRKNLKSIGMTSIILKKLF